MRNSYHIKELKIEVNRNCPLKCLHCSSNGMPNAPEQLSPEKVGELIREFAYLGGEKVCISGGEPLCYEGLPAVIDACRRTNIETAIYTTGISSNGRSLQPISDRMVALLSESGVKFIFSLHGARAKTHDALTQVQGSFKTTMIAIEQAINAGASVEVHVVPTAINFKDIADITKLLASMNIRKVSWLRFVPQGRGQLNRDALQLNKEQLIQLAKTKIKLQQMYRTIQIRTGSPFNILCPQFAVPCDAGLSVLTVRPDGCTAPCDAFKQFRTKDDFGNVLYHSLSEVWEKSGLLNEVRRIHDTRLTSPCTSCPLYAQCNSGCLAQKAIAAGRLTDGKDPECLLNGVEARCGEVEAIPVC
ncbi:putative mycofactocin radical SAM maturase MftC [subsurface metagenome]